ncbi:MAG: hypothetical protein HKN16_10625 [Saprospiraceae bacterium]|nr:hypothetical protein [Saprospiraceae bacterium]
MTRSIYIFGLILLLSACTNEEENLVIIDPALQTYVYRFIDEGAERNVDVDFTLEGITIEIENIETNGVPGQCQSYDGGANILLIDPQFWSAYSEVKKELLLFHELGHCYLGLAHDDNKDENGNCLSIMHSSSSVCEIDFSGENREQLLDELFEK